MKNDPNQVEQQLSFDTDALLHQYEGQALARVFGKQAPVARGHADGLLLDGRQKNRAIYALKAAFHQQKDQLIRLLQLKRGEIQTTIRRKKAAVHQAELALRQLEVNQGGRHLFEKAMLDTAGAFRDAGTNHAAELKALRFEQTAKAGAIENMLATEIPQTELLEPGGMSNYKKLTALVLRLGRPSEQAAGQGYWAFFNKRLGTIVRERQKESAAFYQQQREQKKADYQFYLNALFELPKQMPSQKLAWLYTVLTVLIFCIEIPVNLNYTARALGLDVTENPVLVYFLSAGLPLVLGLAAKVIINGAFDQQKSGLRWLIAVLGLFLVCCIGLLNGFINLLAEQRAAFVSFIPVLRWGVFFSATLLLSVVGAVFFGWAQHCWSLRRILGGNSLQPEEYQSQVQTLEIQKARIRDELLELEGLLEQLEGFVQPQPKGQLSQVAQAFENAYQSAVASYTYGFENGWRSRILVLINQRKPVPLSVANQHSNLPN